MRVPPFKHSAARPRCRSRKSAFDLPERCRSYRASSQKLVRWWVAHRHRFRDIVDREYSANRPHGPLQKTLIIPAWTCTKLETIAIAASVSLLGTCCFELCCSLESVDFCAGLKLERDLLLAHADQASTRGGNNRPRLVPLTDCHGASSEEPSDCSGRVRGLFGIVIDLSVVDG
jgi:hypothetical protein